MSDGEVEKIIAKLVKSNRETLQRIDGDVRQDRVIVPGDENQPTDDPIVAQGDPDEIVPDILGEPVRDRWQIGDARCVGRIGRVDAGGERLGIAFLCPAERQSRHRPRLG